MLKVNETQIEQIAHAFFTTEPAQAVDLSHLICEGETLAFYQGMISGLVISHQLVLACKQSPHSALQFVSLAAARAAEQYLKLKDDYANTFPEIIGEQ
ncbi:MAG: hypothetical protein ABIP75_17355 [Pyrinomonadaceae bacterium]